MRAEHAAALREAMVDEHLVARGIRSATVLDAMARVPRHEFLPPELEEYAYDDAALRVGTPEETISQPYVVAWMLELAQAGPGVRLLEVGTGTGYSAAVAAVAGAEVFTIDRNPALSLRARATLDRLGVHCIAGDGWEGLASEAPFDAISVGCALAEPSPRWLDQLAPTGRLVVPLGTGDHQILTVITRSDGGFLRSPEGAVAFVPLVR